MSSKDTYMYFSVLRLVSSICMYLLVEIIQSLDIKKNVCCKENLNKQYTCTSIWLFWSISMHIESSSVILSITRGPYIYISCTWVQCAIFVDRLARAVILVGTKNTNLVEDVLFLLPDKFRQISFSAVPEKKSKMSQTIRCLGFPKSRKKLKRTLSSGFLQSFVKFRRF